MIQSNAYARICFFGDHQDYLNLPVIAGTIDRKIHLNAEPNNAGIYNLQLIDIDQHVKIDLNENIKSITNGDYFRSGLELLRKKGFSFSQGYDIEISGDIPVNAGVSSSSALVVMWLRFLVKAQDTQIFPSKEQLGHWSYEAEVLYFNQPGGLMDQYTIAQEGVLFIDTKTGITTPLTANLGSLVLAESGISKQTLNVLKNARIYGQEAIKAVQQIDKNFDIFSADSSDMEKYMPFVPNLYKNHWKAAVLNYNITLKAKDLLLHSNPDIQQLGELMNEHQFLLQECIQNTPEPMITQMNAARKAGALGAKIIGSGGGGCMVAITTKGKEKSVATAFIKAGAKNAYTVQLT